MKMLDFAARHHVAPVTETFPMSQINEAVAHLASGKGALSRRADQRFQVKRSEFQLNRLLLFEQLRLDADGVADEFFSRRGWGLRAGRRRLSRQKNSLGLN